MPADQPPGSDTPFYNLLELQRNVPDAATAGELLLSFHAGIGAESAALERAWRAQDQKALAGATHRLASASLYLGIDGIGRPAAALEAELDAAADRSTIAAQYHKLIAACERFQRQSRAELIALVVP